jgi:hypothetical protein
VKVILYTIVLDIDCHEYDMALSYDNQEFHVLTIDSALRLETNAAFVATNDKRQTVDAHLASAYANFTNVC